MDSYHLSMLRNIDVHRKSNIVYSPQFSNFNSRFVNQDHSCTRAQYDSDTGVHGNTKPLPTPDGTLSVSDA